MMWVLYSHWVALTVNIVLLLFLIAFIVNGFDIMSKLYVNEDDAVSGKF